MTLRTNLCLLSLSQDYAFFFLIAPFQLIFFPLFCILNSSMGMYRFVHPLLPLLFLYFLFFSKKCIKGTMLPLPFFFPRYTQYSLWQCGPLLLCSFRTWWQMKQPSLNRWLWAGGCGWWVVQGYHVKKKKKKNLSCPHIQQSYFMLFTNFNN